MTFLKQGGEKLKNVHVFLILATVLSAYFATGCCKQKNNDTQSPKFLYVMSAKSGSFDGDTLTLKDVPLVIYFSDRPNRIAGHVSLNQFVEIWNKGADSFKEDPPNATLSIYDGNGNKDVVIELIGTPTIRNESIIFGIRILLGELPKEIPSSSLFIDVFTKNVLPTFQVL